MQNNYGIAPKFQMRRLLMCESDRIVKLYSQLKKDAPFVGKTAVRAIMQNGAFYGVFQGENLLACGGFCKQNTPLSFVKRLCCSYKISKSAMVIMPFAGEIKHSIKLLNYFCKENSNLQFVFAMPITTDKKLLNACFLNKMTLVALRPLENLRIHHIFFYKGAVQTNQNESIIILLQDTLILSRSLEQGYAGVELDENYIRLEKKNEGGNT